MATQLQEVEFETRTIGPLVLTTPVLRRLGFREMVNRHCPIAEQAELDHGLVAELVTQSRLSDPTALYDLPGWAERLAIAALYPEIERTGQVNDDRAGRMLDALYDQRAVIWGDVVAKAARHYGLDLHRLHADTMAMTFAGLFADQPSDAGVPRLEPGYNPAGEWLQQLKLCALPAGDGGVPVWFDMLSGGTGDSTTYAPQFAAFSNHARLARFLPLEDIILIGDRNMPTAENQVTWLRLHLGYIGPITLQDHHCQLSGPSTGGWGTPSRSPTLKTLPATGRCGTCMCIRVPWRAERRPGGKATCRPSKRNCSASRVWSTSMMTRRRRSSPDGCRVRPSRSARRKNTSPSRWCPMPPARPRPWNCATAWTTRRCNEMPNLIGCTCWLLAAKRPACRMQRSWPSGRGSTRWSTAFAWRTSSFW